MGFVFMTLEEIRKNAPEGATHYKIDSGYTLYYRDDIYALWLWIKKGEWVITRYRLGDIKPI